MRVSLPVIALVVACLIPAAALAQWSDNFDSYPVGPLVPQGGWIGWNNNNAATAYVVAQPFRSAPHSAEAQPTTDCVHEYSGVNSGQWIYSAWSYVPSGSIGDQYFILLNTYPAAASSNWSCQVFFDTSAGAVSDFDNPTGPAIPIPFNQWAEVRVEIDFGADFQNVYYNGVLLNSKSWTAGTAPGGALNLAAVDLYSDNASSIYWDDMVLRQAGATPVEPSTWGQIKSRF